MKYVFLKMKEILNNERGDVMTSLLRTTGALIFIIFPLFSFLLERYVIEIKAQDIRAMVDMANLSTYYALNIQETSVTNISLNNQKALDIYKDMIVENLKLNSDLTPKDGSIAEGPVSVDSFQIYSSGVIPIDCPNGTEISKPSIHSVITIPMKPMLYRKTLLQLMNKPYVEVIIHTDTEIPVNN